MISFQPKFRTTLKVDPPAGKEWAALDAMKGSPGKPAVAMNFGRFMASLTSLLERLDRARSDAAVATAFHIEALYQAIVELTPVDRSPWADDIVAKELWDLDVEQDGDVVTWVLSNAAKNPKNNYPYPVALEYGHSDQAPDGMIRITLEKFRQGLMRDLRTLKAEAANTLNVAALKAAHGRLGKNVYVDRNRGASETIQDMKAMFRYMQGRTRKGYKGRGRGGKM